MTVKFTNMGSSEKGILSYSSPHLFFVSTPLVFPQVPGLDAALCVGQISHCGCVRSHLMVRDVGTCTTCVVGVDLWWNVVHV